MRFFFVFIVLSFISFNCKSVENVVKPDAENQNTGKAITVMLDSFPKEKPEWIFEIPSASETVLTFVSVSYNCATEKDARESAMRNAINEFAKYCGVDVTDIYKSAAVNFGLSSDITNPSRTEITNTKMSAEAFVSKFKAKKWYLEIWVNKIDDHIIDKYYKAYVYAEVPADEYNKVLEYKKNGK